VEDVDGNKYKTVIIGNQEWMKENLKTTKYNDNTSIILTTNSTSWSNMTTPPIAGITMMRLIIKVLMGLCTIGTQ
jgi:hypothetical protein